MTAGWQRPPRIYVASSWRNERQPEIVRALRHAGFEVYDFKDPSNDKGAFHWSDVGGPDYKNATPSQFIEFLRHPRAEEGFRQDFEHMGWADACVLVLPAGRSANLEAGWFVGSHKPLVVLTDGLPDLMYKMATKVVANPYEVAEATAEALRYKLAGQLPCGCDSRFNHDRLIDSELT